MKYRSEIDGLRAVAVLPVIFFHAGFHQFSGGFIGVDIFFVISGYLITSILLKEIEAGHFKISKFYERRARRILPALIFIILVCLPFAWAWLPPEDLISFSKSILGVATFSSNFFFWLESGYFDSAAELKPLLHTWSLAVEEQYYILFPLFLVYTWRYGKKAVLGLISLIFIASLMWAHWLVSKDTGAAFFLLPSRAWELIIGVFCAFYLQRFGLSDYKINHLLSLLGLSLILISIFQFTNKTPTPSVYTLLPTLGTALIILFATKDTLVNKLLSTRPFVFIGLISYSAYLWHQPILVFSRHRLVETSNTIQLALVALSIILALLTWQFIEKPFRTKASYSWWSTKQVLRLSAVLLCTLFLLGLPSFYFDGFPNRTLNTPFTLKIADYNYNNTQLRQESWAPLRKLSQESDYAVKGNDFDQALWFDLKDNRKKVLIIGNSHSKDIWNILNESNYNQRYQFARYGLQIRDLADDSHDLYSAPNFIHSDIIVIASQYNEKDREVLENVVEKLFTNHKQVVVIKNIYEFKQYNHARRNLADKIIFDAIQQGATNTNEISDISDTKHYEYYVTYHSSKRVHQANDEIDSIQLRHPEVVVLDRMDYACSVEQQKCFSLSNSLQKYYYDYGHHTLAGATFFAARVDELNWFNMSHLTKH